MKDYGLKCSFRHNASSLTCKAYLDPALWSALHNSLFGSGCGCMGQFTQCTCPESARCCLVGAACLYLLASLTALIPVSWMALSIFHADHGLSSIRFHMGEALFVGWLALCLLCMAGLLQCCSGPLGRAGQEKKPPLDSCLAQPA